MPFIDGGHSDKRGLAWAYFNPKLMSAAAIFEALDLPADAPWHSWRPLPNERGIGNKISHVKEPAQLPEFYEYVSGGRVIFGNECDLPDQCNTPSSEMAIWLIEMSEFCPACEFIGPCYSVLDDGRLSLDFWNHYLDQGGDPGRIYAGCLHLYPLAGITSAGTRVDAYYDRYMIPTGQDHKPVWVTEVGWVGEITCELGVWLEELEADSRVEFYFGYSPMVLSGGEPFTGFIDPAGNLTQAGQDFRNMRER